jgi:hypothetical protein
MADVMCEVRGYCDVNVELLIGNLCQRFLGVKYLILQMYVCDYGIMSFKCRIVIWKYVSVCAGRLQFFIAGVQLCG